MNVIRFSEVVCKIKRVMDMKVRNGDILRYELHTNYDDRKMMFTVWDKNERETRFCIASGRATEAEKHVR